MGTAGAHSVDLEGRAAREGPGRLGGRPSMTCADTSSSSTPHATLPTSSSRMERAADGLTRPGRAAGRRRVRRSAAAPPRLTGPPATWVEGTGPLVQLDRHARLQQAQRVTDVFVTVRTELRGAHAGGRQAGTDRRPAAGRRTVRPARSTGSAAPPRQPCRRSSSALGQRACGNPATGRTPGPARHSRPGRFRYRTSLAGAASPARRRWGGAAASPRSPACSTSGG